MKESMREFTINELAKVLADHKRWVDTDGAVGHSADLSRADLTGHDFARVVLSEACLSRSLFNGASFSGAKLFRADLRGSNLSGADLRDTDLYGANLSRTKLRYADFRGADLRRAVLVKADLYGADLRGANLRGVDFYNSVISLSKIDADEIAARSIVPAVGPFRGWKKVADGTVVELEIPADAARCGGVASRTCRASHVRVIAGEGVSWHDGKTRYTPGAIVRAANYDTDPCCSVGHGIHFFITHAEADAYVIPLPPAYPR